MVVAVLASRVDALDAAFRFLKNDEEENPYKDFYWESWPGEREWLRSLYESGDTPDGGWEQYGGLPAIFPELFPEGEEPEEGQEEQGGQPAHEAEGELGLLGGGEAEAAPRSARLGIEHGIGPMGTRQTIDRETGEAAIELVPQRGIAVGQQYAAPDRQAGYKYRSTSQDHTRGKRWVDPQELRRKEVAAYYDAPHRVADINRDREQGTGAWRPFDEEKVPPEGHVTVRSKHGTRHIPAETYTKPHPAFVRYGEKEKVDEDGS